MLGEDYILKSLQSLFNQRLGTDIAFYSVATGILICPCMFVGCSRFICPTVAWASRRFLNYSSLVIPNLQAKVFLDGVFGSWLHTGGMAGSDLFWTWHLGDQLVPLVPFHYPTESFWKGPRLKPPFCRNAEKNRSVDTTNLSNRKSRPVNIASSTHVIYGYMRSMISTPPPKKQKQRCIRWLSFQNTSSFVSQEW